MPTGEEHGQALRDLVACIEGSDREIVEEIDAETDEGDPVNGFFFSHGGRQLAVYGPDDGVAEYFTVQYRFHAAFEYAQKCALESYEGELEGEFEIDVPLEEAESELDDLAEEHPEEYETLAVRLHETVSSPLSAFQLERTENGAIKSLIIEKKIFPYEDKFNTSDFNEAVQAIASKAVLGERLLTEAYNISSIDLGETKDTEEQDPSHRYIG